MAKTGIGTLECDPPAIQRAAMARYLMGQVLLSKNRLQKFKSRARIFKEIHKIRLSLATGLSDLEMQDALVTRDKSKLTHRESIAAEKKFLADVYKDLCQHDDTHLATIRRLCCAIGWYPTFF